MNDILYVGKHPQPRASWRRNQESWEFVYCVSGEGTLRFEGEALLCKRGDVAIIPPQYPHSFVREKGSRCIHISMAAPTLSPGSPTVIHDDAHHFLLDAMTAALFYFRGNRPERAVLLSLYSSVICCYLAAYQNVKRRSRVVEEIEKHILAHYTDPGYELDQHLKSLPFNYDYLRKLFQKEMLVTPHQFLTGLRLQTAAEALTSYGPKAGNITDIARMCGFREPLYFSRMFKKKYGVAPSFYFQARADGKGGPTRSDA
ncbi:MAG: helix-turn-helix domain-containing protein [Clostridia bacterium]|nr:helix-turn-helix domain-containing protein [Clostridia bacterium]